MSGGPVTRLGRAALVLAALASMLAAAAMVRELSDGRAGALRAAFAAVAGVAAIGCLASARREPAGVARILVPLGGTLGVCAAVALA